MIGIGILGSVTDVATFLAVLIGVHRIRESVETLAAGVVAVAREHRRVDDDRLQAELEVDDVDVAALQHPVRDGGDGGGSHE
ncbi:hypothetical protein [Haloarcula salina]|uniref:Uncharacterized protein n=1 Tax=Haloarcula salina TaxID=1429914 RepID=A0AA41GC02_9EURY|nr:hypothetical protein [Haloarcula salina]MBV0903937.1 hypothetical protein [Haloarcula salina]